MTTPWCHTHTQRKPGWHLAAAWPGWIGNGLPASLTSALTNPAHRGMKTHPLSWPIKRWHLVLFSAGQGIFHHWCWMRTRKGKTPACENDLELQALVSLIRFRRKQTRSDHNTKHHCGWINQPLSCWYTQPRFCMGDKTGWYEKQASSALFKL